MKTNVPIVRWLALVSILSAIACRPSVAQVQGTAFSYQGRLNTGGGPANGSYDLTFALFNSSSGMGQVGATLTNLNLGVTNGLFLVTLDFGSGIFTGANLWLQIGVRTNGAASFTTLLPRQPILPAPYAVMANSASNLLGALPVAQLSGTVPLAQLPVSVLTNNENGVALANLTLNGNLNLAAATTNTGVIYAGGLPLLYGDANSNFFAGSAAGNLTMSGSDNTGVGLFALYQNTNGSYNTANGAGALYFNTNGSYNTAAGAWALRNLTDGSHNIALGYQAGLKITHGSFNIDIGNPGTVTDSNVIRIGSGQSQTFIAGQLNANGSGLTNLNWNAITNQPIINGGSDTVAQIASAVANGVVSNNFALGIPPTNFPMIFGTNVLYIDSTYGNDDTASNAPYQLPWAHAYDLNPVANSNTIPKGAITMAKPGDWLYYRPGTHLVPTTPLNFCGPNTNGLNVYVAPGATLVHCNYSGDSTGTNFVCSEFNVGPMFIPGNGSIIIAPAGATLIATNDPVGNDSVIGFCPSGLRANGGYIKTGKGAAAYRTYFTNFVPTTFSVMGGAWLGMNPYYSANTIVITNQDVFMCMLQTNSGCSNACVVNLDGLNLTHGWDDLVFYSDPTYPATNNVLNTRNLNSLGLNTTAPNVGMKMLMAGSWNDYGSTFVVNGTSAPDAGGTNIYNTGTNVSTLNGTKLILNGSGTPIFLGSGCTIQGNFTVCINGTNNTLYASTNGGYTNLSQFNHFP